MIRDRSHKYRTRPKGWTYGQFIFFIPIVLAANATLLFIVTAGNLDSMKMHGALILFVTFAAWYFKAGLTGWHATLFARRNFVAASVVLAFLLFALLQAPLSGQSMSSLVDSVGNNPIPSAQCIVVAIILGTLLRSLITTLSYMKLTNRLPQMQHYLAILGFALVVFLIPELSFFRREQGHPPSPSLGPALNALYYLGIGLGFITQHTFRGVIRASARRERLRQNINRIVSGDGNVKTRPINHDEELAVQYYIDGKLGKLKKLLEHDEERLTTRLKLIKACMHRIKGEYTEAVALLKPETRSPGRDHDLDSKLLVLLALCYSEIEPINNRKDTYDALRMAWNNNRTCVLYHLTKGLRSAEEMDLAKDSSSAELDRSAPLRYVQEAIRLNATSGMAEIDSKLVGISVPITGITFLDALGYTLLAAGDLGMSKSMFIRCIAHDPSFSAPYLHLGEWYLCARNHTSNETERTNRTELARLCFTVAKKLERPRKSLIRRRAKELLREASKLQLEGRT